MAVKGKQVAEKTPTSKRKLHFSDKSDGRKRKNPAALQFFEVAADVDHDEDESEAGSDDDDFFKDFVDEDNAGHKEKSQFGNNTPTLPFLPKEEELSDSELGMLIKERYRPGSKYVVYADDKNKATESGAKFSLIHSTDDPIIWRVKCMVGRERRIVFCLIRKSADLQSLGNRLKIFSAFAPEHVKGYIYVEAERESDVLEACKGLPNIYSSRILQVPKNEVAHLFSIRNSSIEVSPGTWVRVKMGKYRGDLAQVVVFDGAQKSATIKITPRIDLQALAQKLAGGGTVKETARPAARVISSRDLEKFRPHIMVTRDSQTGKKFETLDGLKLKNGYLYKKVSIDSISSVDVVPTADELLKFKPCKKDASDDQEWLSHLYGEQRKKGMSECSGGTTKDLEGTCGTKKGDDFQLHDLVCFGRKDFGVIIGVESDDVQILKYHEVEGAEVLNVELHEIESSGFDKKFTTTDHNMKATSIKDSVRVLDGPFKGKQGVVRHICKGTIFIFDENQLENGGYFCAKSKLCENISHSNKSQHESIGDVFGQGDVFGAQGFEDSMSSPKSPQSCKRPWQDTENCDFSDRHQGDRGGEFSVGQTLRIRVGPLKGHLCRVISIYRSGLTVKVDSQTKVMSVKREHLSEPGVRKGIDGSGTQEEASRAPTESNGWNSEPLTAGRSSWPDFSSDLLPDSLVATDASEKDKGDGLCGCKEIIKETTNSWENATGFTGDLEKGKEEGNDPWGSKAASENPTDRLGDAIGWGGEAGKDEEGDGPEGSKMSKEAPVGWGNAAESGEDHKKEVGDCPWVSKATTTKKYEDSWGDATDFGKGPGKGNDEEDDPWGCKATAKKATDCWGNAVDSVEVSGRDKEVANDPWGSKTTSKKIVESWDNVVSCGDDHGKSKEGGDDPWGGKVNISQNGTTSCANAADLGKEGADDSLGSKVTSEKAITSWDTGLAIGEDSGKGKGEGKGVAHNIESGWGSAVVVQDTGRWGSGSDSHFGQEDSCSKDPQSWNCSGKSKPDWTQSETIERASPAWRSGAGGTGASNSSSWSSTLRTPNDPCDNQLGWTSGAINSSGRGSGSNANTWRGGKSFGGSRGFGHDLESSDYSNRGRGRAGRSGSNGGGFARELNSGAGESSDFPNRGRGFGWGRSSNRGGSGNRGRGRRDQSDDWSSGQLCGDIQSFGWGKSAKDDTGDQGGCWGGSSNSSRGGFGYSRGRGRRGQITDRRDGKPQADTQSFGWNNAAGEQGGGWGNQNGETSTNEAGWGKSTGGNGETSGRGGDQADNAWGETAASSWGKGGW